MKTTHKFTAYNRSSIFIYGTENEAILFLKLINSRSDVVLYKKSSVSLNEHLDFFSKA